MPYTKQTFAYAGGARTFTLALASDYDQESNIAVYVVGELTGGGDQIFRTFTFDSEFVINVTDAIDNPSDVVVQRTVSPTIFSVDFEAGADVTKRNLQLAFRQQFFLMQEILDGRVDGVDVSSEAANSATSAAASAASAVTAAADAIAAAASAAEIDVSAFVRKDGTTAFTGKVIGIAPTADLHLSTKKYVDDVVGGGGAMLLDGSNQMAAQMDLQDADPTQNEHATRKKYVDDGLALKSNIASPTFTGNPLAPTQTPGNDTTRIATTAFVKIAAAASSAFSAQLLHMRDEKNANVDGGTFTSGAWRKRDLNTIVTNEISATLNASEFVLLAGTYYIQASLPAFRAARRNKSRLYNVTDAAVEIEGSTAGTAGGDNTIAHSFITGRFTISGTKTFRLEHRSSATQSSTGFGEAANLDSATEVYTEVSIWKVA